MVGEVTTGADELSVMIGVLVICGRGVTVRVSMTWEGSSEEMLPLVGGSISDGRVFGGEVSDGRVFGGEVSDGRVLGGGVSRCGVSAGGVLGGGVSGVGVAIRSL